MVHKWLETTNKKSWVPMQGTMSITRSDKCNSSQAKQYQELVGQLLWVSNTVQPDVSFTVGVLAQHMTSPINSAWKVVIHMVKYLNQTFSWKSYVQKCVALSAVEAKFIAASEAIREALFFSYLLKDLEAGDVQPVLCTDSQGCIQVSKDPAKHWKLKHIDAQYHFI
ncbi:hypothetical protein NDA11_004089 [Ustilago hordei]|uniref:Reverse transcriptase Ty1/copia-type domain-containing protein n=1 Tax=Ustilago hordei TaxID=120017 RepID=I2FNF3_USTHO|nr:uncharacterized protein UHO2_07036 [Ustilago hordei]KAJ1038641.1 hypothetical protein NDA10_000683 [Ustilago hordei]KAJ1572365.1 hypothetical protein NDA11_004089 [Ustilago hordei]KAJ1591366.1 hypothetical protein NDA15_002264 [Ustilago hordei]KAJ1593674.1 hypothetical protein NDA12_005084 [Ustilago hordei]UTT88482.1 hypothetical protein NDA17_003194 [Ustilago hordei]